MFVVDPVLKRPDYYARLKRRGRKENKKKLQGLCCSVSSMRIEPVQACRDRQVHQNEHTHCERQRCRMEGGPYVPSPKSAAEMHGDNPNDRVPKNGRIGVGVFFCRFHQVNSDSWKI